jgi:hypothetical protein
VYGVVTEVLCPTHERPARQAFAELGIEYTARPVVDGGCHRCAGWRPWQSRPGTSGQAPTGPRDERPPPPAGTGWFEDGPPWPGASCDAERQGSSPGQPHARPSTSRR